MDASMFLFKNASCGLHEAFSAFVRVKLAVKGGTEATEAGASSL
jgi:hypothetical protein